MENLWLFTRRKKETYKDDMRKRITNFSSRILMMTRFIYVCLRKFNFFLINSHRKLLVSRPLGDGTWKASAAPSPDRHYFDLSEIYSNKCVNKL